MYVKYNAVLRGQNGGGTKWTRSAKDMQRQASSLHAPFNRRKSSQPVMSTGFLELYQDFMDLCKQNMYPTTLHAINSAVLKLGKLMKVQKVYRGLSGKKLPEQMLEKNVHGVRGGIEVRAPRPRVPLSARRRLHPACALLVLTRIALVAATFAVCLHVDDNEARSGPQVCGRAGGQPHDIRDSDGHGRPRRRLDVAVPVRARGGDVRCSAQFESIL